MLLAGSLFPAAYLPVVPAVNTPSSSRCRSKIALSAPGELIFMRRTHGAPFLFSCSPFCSSWRISFSPFCKPFLPLTVFTVLLHLFRPSGPPRLAFLLAFAFTWGHYPFVCFSYPLHAPFVKLSCFLERKPLGSPWPRTGGGLDRTRLAPERRTGPDPGRGRAPACITAILGTT